MKKIFTRWRRQESWSSGSSTSTGRSRVGDRGPGYHIRGKDLKEIHKAASVGNAVKVRQILLLQINALNDRDKMNRTALHLACANGHPEVVTLLADQKKCLLDLCDRQNRTALFKAVQCQQEECAAVLLARGAHPNVVDIDGNTALHCAVLGQNAAIVAKLLSYGANMEARNKDGFTSLSLAKKQNKEQMVELLIKSNAKVDLMDRPTTQRENSKDQVISQTYCQAEKTSENQRTQISLPRLHLEKMSPESEMNRECDSDDMSTYSGYPSVQKYEKMWIKQSKLEQRKNLQLMPNELKQKFGEICKKYKIAACPEEEPLHDKSKEGPSLRQIPSNLTNNILDCEEKDAFGMSVSAVFQTSPEREEPTLENISLSHSYCGSSTDAPCSFYKLCSREKILLSENKHKSDTEQVFNKSEERFYNDAENKVRNPAVTFEMKEYQGFGMQMTKNMNPNTTNWKLGIRHTPQSRVLKSPFDLWLPHCNHIKNTVQMKKHAISVVTNTYKETKPNADLFQKPLFIDNCSASNCKSMKYGIEDMSSSPPYSDRTPNVYANKKMQQDIQRFQNEIDMFKLELLALEKEQLQLQKQVEEENEKQKISKMKVTKDINKVAGDDSNGLIKQRDCKQADDQQFPITKKGDSDRSLKEISYEEYKVKEKINSMDDLDDLIHSTETVSEPCQSPHSKCENFTLLIKQPCKHFKDSNTLFQIQDAVLVCERAKERGKYQCELHTQKVKTVENGASGLHKKSSETREIESLLKHQKVELEQELWNLRFALKEEKEKRQKADLLYEKSREQLMKTEEQCAKETEMSRDLESTVRTLEMELKKVRQNLSQVVEVQNETQRQLSQEQNARKLQEENLINLLCKQNELEIAYKEMKSENNDLTEKLETASSKCLLLDENNKFLQQELLSMKAIDKQCENLEDKNEKLKQEVMNLKRHMKMNMVEFSEVEQYKWKIEKRAREHVAEKLKQVHLFLQVQRASQEYNSEIQRHLEIVNNYLESKLSKMQASLNCSKIELENYVRLYQKEVESRKSLENELNKTMERLAKIHGILLLQKRYNCDLLSIVHRRQVQQTLCVINSSNRFESNAPSTPKQSEDS